MCFAALLSRHGLGTIPELGWEGIAIGTAIGYAVGGSIIIAYLIQADVFI